MKEGTKPGHYRIISSIGAGGVGDGKPFPILTTAANELQPKLSPDGKWLTYSSDESGSYEIYVQSFTAEGKLGAERKRVRPRAALFQTGAATAKSFFMLTVTDR